MKVSKKRDFLTHSENTNSTILKHNINLRIQWKFQGVSFSLPEDPGFFAIQKNLEIVKIHNKEVLSLSSENMFVILCIHASGHYWDRLSWICDVSELIKSNEFNWDYILKKQMN